MLPSRHAAEAYRKMALVKRHQPENVVMLRCPDCGRKGKYNIGALVVNPHDPDPFPSLQCTGYFRCKHCNAAGDWDFPPLLSMQIIGSAFIRDSAEEWTDDRIIFGRAPLYDGYEGRFATDSEEHLLQQLRQSPEDGWLWDRLGNLYHHAGRPDLAIVAFEEAVRRDPEQFESHFTLGMLLSVLDHQEESGHHLRLALATARSYSRLDPLRLRELAAVSLRELVGLHDRTGGKVPVMPTREEYGAEQFTSLLGGDGPVSLQTLGMNTDDLSTFHPIAETFVGQERIAASQRAMEPQHARTEIAASRGTPVRVGRKVGRNEPCPCGSGLKYKRCCGRGV